MVYWWFGCKQSLHAFIAEGAFSGVKRYHIRKETNFFWNTSTTCIFSNAMLNISRTLPIRNIFCTVYFENVGYGAQRNGGTTGTMIQNYQGVLEGKWETMEREKKNDEQRDRDYQLFFFFEIERIDSDGLPVETWQNVLFHWRGVMLYSLPKNKKYLDVL